MVCLTVGLTEKSGLFRCELCSTLFNASRHFLTHLSSKKHVQRIAGEFHDQGDDVKKDCY
jgi:hypothetical protein